MPYPPAPPSDPSLCVLYGYVRTVKASPVDGAQVTVIPTPQPDFVGGVLGGVAGSGVSADRVTANTDVNGWFEVELMRKAEVKIEIPEIGLSLLTEIPDADSADLATLPFVPRPAGVLNREIP